MRKRLKKTVLPWNVKKEAAKVEKEKSERVNVCLILKARMGDD